jgi:hypothetical protein
VQSSVSLRFEDSLVSPRKRPSSSILAADRHATELSSVVDSSTKRRLGADMDNLSAERIHLGALILHSHFFCLRMAVAVSSFLASTDWGVGAGGSDEGSAMVALEISRRDREHRGERKVDS